MDVSGDEGEEFGGAAPELTRRGSEMLQEEGDGRRAGTRGARAKAGGKVAAVAAAAGGGRNAGRGGRKRRAEDEMDADDPREKFRRRGVGSRSCACIWV